MIVWRRWPLPARLFLASAVVLIVAGAGRLVVSARGELAAAGERMARELEQETRILPGLVSDPVIVGDFARLHQYLEHQVRRTGIQRIAFLERGRFLLASEDTPIPVAAPAWFAAWSGLKDLRRQVPVRAGGREYGSLDITYSAQDAINTAWERFVAQMRLLGLALGFNFIALWHILRRGLRPLADLDTASRDLADGRFDAPIPVRGAPEMRHVIEAFNHMAGKVQDTLKALSESEGNLSAILHSIGDGLIATDTATRVTYLNPVAEGLTGWSQAEAAGRPVTEVLVIHNALTGEAAEIPVARVLETGKVVGLANHTLLIARDGRRYHIADSAAPVRDASGRLTGVVMVFRDVSESYSLRATLEESRARLALALKGADLGLWDWDLRTNAVVYDKRWASMLGYTLEEIEPTLSTWEHLVHPEDLPRAWRALQEHLAGGSPQYEAEVRMRTRQGAWRWILTRGGITARDAQGQPIRITGTHLDIDERRGAQAQLERMAFFDSLTGLPNRRLLLDRVTRELASARRESQHGALLFIDLDHFKQINDSLGHSAGDHVLEEAARRMLSLLREVDSVARLGGDEFVVMLTNLDPQAAAAAAAARQVAEKLRAALAEPFVLNQGEYHLGASIGVTLFPDSALASAEDLLREADTALYRAKDAGRNAIRFFEPDMQFAVEARMALERDLRTAMQKRELKLYLQPQFDASGRLTGAEILLRWPHPQRGQVPPSAFIPLAEETGLIVALGAWVLETSAHWLRRLEDAGLDIGLSVNVSPRQFREAGFTREVREILARTGASPGRLTLEITEGLFLHHTEEMTARLHELRSLGLRFSIDDFGTGFSSLSYLKHLPLDEVKIDRTFVDGLPNATDDASLVATILLIAGQMDLEVVAEGVETEAQRTWLAQHGCDRYQGYLLGRPQPIENFLALVGAPFGLEE